MMNSKSKVNKVSKDLCVIYTNCQFELIKQYLMLSQNFIERYFICEEVPRTYIARNKKLTLPEAILRKAKLFIYQPLSSKYGKMSSEYILSILPKDCIKISVPYIYFSGYWPQYSKVKQDIGFAYSDSNIIKLLSSGYNSEEIITKISDISFYKRDDLYDCVGATLDHLERREQQTDIKIKKFIEQNYSTHRLFHSVNHPCSIIGLNVVNQILNFLDMPSLREVAEHEVLRKYQFPIYPSVINQLELKFFESENITYYLSTDGELTFQQYISKYINILLKRINLNNKDQ